MYMHKYTDRVEFESRVFIENWKWVSNKGCGSYLIHPYWKHKVLHSVRISRKKGKKKYQNRKAKKSCPNLRCSLAPAQRPRWDTVPELWAVASTVITSAAGARRVSCGPFNCVLEHRLVGSPSSHCSDWWRWDDTGPLSPQFSCCQNRMSGVNPVASKRLLGLARRAVCKGSSALPWSFPQCRSGQEGGRSYVAARCIVDVAIGKYERGRAPTLTPVRAFFSNSLWRAAQGCFGGRHLALLRAAS